MISAANSGSARESASQTAKASDLAFLFAWSCAYNACFSSELSICNASPFSRLKSLDQPARGPNVRLPWSIFRLKRGWRRIIVQRINGFTIEVDEGSREQTNAEQPGVNEESRQGHPLFSLFS